MTLLKLTRGGVCSARKLKRARVLQLLHDGWAICSIKEAAGVWPSTIRRVRDRYLDGGLEAALNELPRPGQKPVLDRRARSRIVAMVCGRPPTGRARWTVRLIVEEAVNRRIVDTVGRETIRTLLLEHDLKPWRKKNVVRSRSR